MSDVKVELKETVSREDAETWLSTLAEAFGGDGHVELPLGPSVVSVHVPDRIRAEIEVEVDGDEVEVEVEFKWSTAKPADDSPAEPLASPGTAQHASAPKPARGSRRLTTGAPFTNLMPNPATRHA
ncbi:MAG TPA: amphi-Trp domain-containing protein [Streptosporangiaceae bacterium]